MPPSFLRITYAYYFLCEAIIVFLPCIWFIHFQYQMPILYSNYVLLIGGICLLFTYITRVSSNYIFYYLTAPLLFFIFYLCQFPLLLSIVIPIILVWRYISIRKMAGQYQHVRYIIITFLLSLFIFLITKEATVLLYLLLQLLILQMGYIASHLAAIPVKERKRFGQWSWFYILAFYLTVVVVIYFLFDYLRLIIVALWNGLTDLFIGGIGFIAQFLSFIESPQFDNELPKNDYGLAENETTQDIFEGSVSSFITKYTSTIVIGGVILFALVVIYLVFRSYKNKFTLNREDDVQSGQVTYEKSIINQVSQKGVKKWFRKHPNKHLHPARKLIYDFEIKARHANKGRRHSETIEEWIDRIGGNVHIQTYESVRYGDDNVSEQEVAQLKHELLEISRQF